MGSNVDLMKHMERDNIDIPPDPPGCIIIVDTREQKPYSFSNPTQKKKLDTGDYSVRNFEGDMSVERKSLPDLVRCVGGDRDRFEKQLHRLNALNHKMLVIDCSWEEIEAEGWHKFSDKVSSHRVKGTLLWIMDMGIPVTIAGCRERAQALTERFLVSSHKREWQRLRRKLLDRS